MIEDETRGIIYPAQPEVVMGKADPGERRVSLVTQDPEVSHPVISEADATVIYDIRCELARARELYPPFSTLWSAICEIRARSGDIVARFADAKGAMDAEVRRKLIQTAAMCLRALTEHG